MEEKEGKQMLLEIRHVRKEFPGVVALDDVSLEIFPGEVHALMGENGAGKSTLMKILAGIYKADAGEIIYKGEPLTVHNPKDSLEQGISIIHQELNMILDMTVEQNLFLGRELAGKTGVVKTKELVKRAQEQFDELGIAIRATDKIRDLSVAQMQMVEIVKATSYNADVIIMDEPTSAITDHEVDKLFEMIETLKRQNKAVIYISHKMDEIFKIADRITVLRDGKYIDSKPSSEFDHDSLVYCMVGRELKDMYPRDLKEEAAPAGQEFFSVKDLTREKEFHEITFQVDKGEILGIYGLMGAGRTELMETIFGLRRPDRGTIAVHGKEVQIQSPKSAIKNGIAFVSEDRKLFGLDLGASIRTNITIVYLKKILKLRHLLDFKKERKLVDEAVELLRIKTPSKEVRVNTLSGGNQQKVVLAKWLLGDPEVIIMDEPTRGIDVGAKAEIYKLMDKLASEGKAIIMISSEMPELMGMSDRVLVLHEGALTGEFKRAEFSQEAILASAIK